MNCYNDVTLTRYLDGETEGAEQTDIKNHLDACSICQQRLDDLVQLKSTCEEVITRLDPISVSVQPFRYEQQTDPVLNWSCIIMGRPIRIVGSAFLVLLVMIVVVWQFTTTEQPEIQMSSTPTVAAPVSIASTTLQDHATVHYTKLNGISARMYIIQDIDSRTRLIWVEKR